MPERLSRRKYAGLQCALICALCGFVSFAPFLFRDGGFFHVWSDFNVQQMPFGMAMHNSLSELNIGGWTWNYGPGMSTIQAFSFYGLGSPFVWISMLLPVNLYPYLAGWIYILKYTAAGVSAFYFIRRFTKKESSAIAGALMYAFSGFQATNLMYYHFHDVVALFPLILLGLEKVLEDPKDRGTLVFAVFLNALNNYYFLVLEATFTGLYFLSRSFGSEKREFRRIGRDLLNTLFCAAWGVAMAAILFLPSMLYILQSPRMDRSVSSADLFWGFRWFFFTVRGLLLPGDVMADQSAFYPEEFGSVAAWLPMAGLGLCLAYVLKNIRKREGWLARMISVLLLLSAFPFLASGFLLATEVTYRWWFMLALLAATASARVIDEEQEYPVKKSLVLYGIVTAVFCAAVFAWNAGQRDAGLLNHPGRFLAFSGIALAGILILWLLSHFRKLNSRILIAMVCLFSTGATLMTLNCYYNYPGDGRENAINLENRENLEKGIRLEVNDGQYRYNLTDNTVMLPGGGSGLTIFSSTIAQGIREFDLLFDYYSKNHMMDKSLVRGLPELFGAAYFLTKDEEDAPEPVQTLEAEGTTWYVAEQAACPIGFAVDHYILRDELMKIPEEDRGVSLLYAVVIEPEEEALLSELCTGLTAEGIPLKEDLNATVSKNRENAVQDFERDSRGFRCASDYSEPRYVWFSVPDEGGWTATIDGEKQEILPSAGMMLLKVPEGRHEIRFVYVTPGYTAGKYISLAAAAVFIAYVILKRMKGRRKPQAGNPA